MSHGVNSLPLYKAIDSGERVNDVVIKLEYTRATKDDLIQELKKHGAREVVQDHTRTLEDGRYLILKLEDE